jgi:hypothetical protein
MGKIKFSWLQSWRKNGLPLRENCDPLDPRQALLPVFTGFAVKGAPLMLPTVFFEELSEHIIEWLGVPVDDVTIEENGKRVKARRLREPLGASLGWVPRRKYQPPATVMNRAVAAGGWVTMDTPDRVSKSVSEALSELPQSDREAVKRAVLEEMGEVEHREPPMHTTARDLAKAIGISTGQIATVLDGWGVKDAKPSTRIDRGLAVRIITHYERARSAG